MEKYVINGYTIQAENFQQALELVSLIQEQETHIDKLLENYRNEKEISDEIQS